MSRLNTIISIGKINYSGRREGGIMGSVLSIAVVTGNPKPASRTLGVATAVAGLLAELGASVPTRALYVTEPQLPELATVVTAWAEIALPQLRQALNQTA